MSKPNWDIQSGSTWKSLTDLKKTEMVRLHDALVQAESQINREAIMRRMIHYPPEHETVFANLIRRVHRIFERNICRTANYKTKCYKEFKRVVNEFQGGLFTDSGKPLRFTLKRRSSPTSTATTTSTTATTTSTTSPQKHSSSARLQPLISNYILHMPDWKIKRFAEMILERNTDEERINFIKKYVHVIDDDGEPFPGLLRDIIVDIVHMSNYYPTTESKIEHIFDYLLHLKNTTYPEVIYVLHPFPVMHPNVFRNGRRNPSVRNLGGGMRRNRRTARKSR